MRERRFLDFGFLMPVWLTVVVWLAPSTSGAASIAPVISHLLAWLR
jgi:hypothetical protein